MGLFSTNAPSKEVKRVTVALDIDGYSESFPPQPPGIFGMAGRLSTSESLLFLAKICGKLWCLQSQPVGCLGKRPRSFAHASPGKTSFQ